MFEHLLAYGSLDHLTSEQLADAVEIDPTQIQGLGPSLQALIEMLEERKRKILETHETQTVRAEAHHVFHQWAKHAQPPKCKGKRFDAAVRGGQVADLERLWYAVDQRSAFARQLVIGIEHLGNRYEIEELAAKYDFVGRQPLTIDGALRVKEELETIDRLLEQLREAMKNAKVYLIDMDALAQFADDQQLNGLADLQNQVNQLLEALAAQQGLERDGNALRLTPKAMRLMQSKLLDQIFADLRASKTGRHAPGATGQGAVETQRTKPYEFGDSLAQMDTTTSLANAIARQGPGLPIRLTTDDIEIHLTRNTPKAATVVCMDTSGSMRWSGQYINVKRMALALHGLIRADFPGDVLEFIELYTFAKLRHASEVATLMPKPVTLREPVVRLRADMSNSDVSELQIPPHFTNIQHALRLARQRLQTQDTPNRQIVLITDGLPTAHFEDRWLYLLYPPHKRTEQATMREALACKREGIVINIFLLPSWSQTEDDVRFAHRLAEQTAGRVFFTAGHDLDRYVVWDYLKQKRYVVG